MDPRERFEDFTEAVREATRGERMDIWTALPGIIQSFDASKMTCEVRPAQMVTYRVPDQPVQNIELPVLLDCPVVFPSGGGCTLTFPLTVGDECLVIFASRCIDSWWDSGNVVPPALFRMHDLSDGFVLPGVKSKPRVIANISATATELRSDDGATKVAVNPSTGTVAVTAAHIQIGDTGDTLRSLVTDLFTDLFNAHTHTVTAVGSPTSAPLVPMDSTQTTTRLKGA